jgi:hypothetical protein
MNTTTTHDDEETVPLQHSSHREWVEDQEFATTGVRQAGCGDVSGIKAGAEGLRLAQKERLTSPD